MVQRAASQSSKKARKEGFMIFYADECSITMMPNLTHTYAPCGKRPVITTSTEVSLRVYIASAISVKGHLIWAVQEKPFTAADIIRFLKQIREAIAQRIMVIWDNASIHNCQEVRRFLTEDQEHNYYLIQQPKYSPHLNAGEQVWSYLKQRELANNCKRNVKELKPKIHNSLDKMAQNPKLIRQFFRHPDIGFYN